MIERALVDRGWLQSIGFLLLDASEAPTRHPAQPTRSAICPAEKRERRSLRSIWLPLVQHVGKIGKIAFARTYDAAPELGLNRAPRRPAFI
jgi:hypothetical protein